MKKNKNKKKASKNEDSDFSLSKSSDSNDSKVKIDKASPKDNKKKKNNQNSNEEKIDINFDSCEIIEKKIQSLIPSKNDVIKIRGDGNCAYRAILTSLGEEPDYKNLRKLTAEQILKDGIDENIYKERNCSSLNEYINKIKNTNFYADEPELLAIAKIKRIWISIYNKQFKNWNILKNSENAKPNNIAFIYFDIKKIMILVIIIML